MPCPLWGLCNMVLVWILQLLRAVPFKDGHLIESGPPGAISLWWTQHQLIWDISDIGNTPSPLSYS
jgi:hypothetical protein